MNGTGPLDLAIRRLERAAGLLEQRLSGASSGAGSLFELDRARLAADLDTCRARERELREAAEQAADAVERAMSAMNAAIPTTEA